MRCGVAALELSELQWTLARFSPSKALQGSEADTLQLFSLHGIV